MRAQCALIPVHSGTRIHYACAGEQGAPDIPPWPDDDDGDAGAMRPDPDELIPGFAIAALPFMLAAWRARFASSSLA